MNINTKIALRKLLTTKEITRHNVLTSLHEVPLDDYADYRHRFLAFVKTDNNFVWEKIEWHVVKEILDRFVKSKFNTV